MPCHVMLCYAVLFYSVIHSFIDPLRKKDCMQIPRAKISLQLLDRFGKHDDVNGRPVFFYLVYYNSCAARHCIAWNVLLVCFCMKQQK
mmetsp:Transcript_21145/g.46123  ORF Transcript_21145/g.46123 Transcript_21145/m.46123 type:complete len:88 (+) Transcript_21145:181-444(+)